VQPSIEDIVLIAQLHVVVEKLLLSREKQSVKVESLCKSRQHMEEGRSFLHKIHTLLQDCAKNLESTKISSDSSLKHIARSPDRELAVSSRVADDHTDAGRETSGKQTEWSREEGGGELTAAVVQVAAEMEDVCMKLNW